MMKSNVEEISKRNEINWIHLRENKNKVKKNIKNFRVIFKPESCTFVNISESTSCRQKPKFIEMETNSTIKIGKSDTKKYIIFWSFFVLFLRR